MAYKADLIPMLVISFGHDQNWTTEEWGEEEKKKSGRMIQVSTYLCLCTALVACTDKFPQHYQGQHVYNDQ